MRSLLACLCAFALAAFGAVLPNPTQVIHAEGHAHHRVLVSHDIERGTRWPVSEGEPSPAPVVGPATGGGGHYPAGVLNAAQVASFARQAGFEEALIPVMVAIAFRESRFNPGAINSSSGACGLWQLYPCSSAAYLTPMGNAWGAREKCLASEAAGAGCLAPWGG